MAKRWLLPVLSPEECRVDSQMAAVNLSDWVRIGKFVRGELPEEWPEIVEVTKGFDWLGIYQPGDEVIIDTEYIVENRHIYQVGFYRPGDECCYIWDRNARHHEHWSQVASWVRRCLGECTVVSQNVQAEMLSFDASFDIPLSEWVTYEDTMLMMAALWSELKKGLGFLASLHGRHDKVKHLGPGAYEYLRGDVVETANVYRALRLEMMQDEGAREAYEYRMRPIAKILAGCKLRGVDLYSDRVDEYYAELNAAVEECRMRLAAYAGWPINPDSGDHISYLLGESEDIYQLVKGSGMRRKKTKGGAISFDKDKSAELHEELEGRGIDHPFLSSLMTYRKARHMASLVFKPFLHRDKVYPDVSIHTQTTGRWSYTNPPLSLLPAKYRDILRVPDGFTLVSGDWSNIEGRVMAAYTDDTLDLEAFDNGWDMHTITCCLLFGIDLPEDKVNPHADAEWCAKWTPAWEGKDDKRRIFSKAFRFSLFYGKLIENLPSIPGAKALGLRDTELVQAGLRWLGTKPGLKKYWEQIERQATKEGVVRTLMGRPRRLLNQDMNARVREAKNAPIQGTVAEFLNETVILMQNELDATYGADQWGWLVMTTHDATYYAFRNDILEECMAVSKRIHERPMHIKDGVDIRIPFDLETK